MINGFTSHQDEAQAAFVAQLVEQIAGLPPADQVRRLTRTMCDWRRRCPVCTLIRREIERIEHA